ncbi:hypothetical protein F2P81_020625 [Scophthalmus maximus]|uniref:Translin-associated factor X-interacting protein 1 N-terminal domain-containing protein n=1 Tax=Scophthalmus maximus TaxID=52904 RepID=A0A6A4SAS1_SCOMX|nr:hypothetical protein F2P81_020625 [Scophthalmus maximus]
MSEPQRSSSGGSTPPGGDDDGRTCLRSLRQFVDQEKVHLRCAARGPEELRYVIYRCAFTKVIARATTYRRLLSTIKAEYDEVIVELKRREAGAEAARRNLAASTISDLQKDTSELQEELKRQKSCEEQRTWIPGLTVAESGDAEALDEHLRHLEAQSAALLDRKSRCVSLEVKGELDAELQAAGRRRDELSAENHRLKVLHKRLRLVCERLEDEGRQVPLEELLSSTLENIRRISVTDDDSRSIDAELFGDEEPTGVDGSELVADHLDRFNELFESAQYEDAALVAARSPGGALLVTVPSGVELSADLSLHCVPFALRSGASQLVAHAVTQNKLTFSEPLGDVLTQHAQENPGVADLCLALATLVYQACGQSRKSALIMCRRGLVHSAAEFMSHCTDLTAEDFIWVVCRSPGGLPLLRLLTEPRCGGRAAILSVGGACSALLVDPQRRELALRLLDDFVGRGRGVLEDVILQDSDSSVDVWIHVASLCSELQRADLSRAVLSVLLDQGGTRVLTPDLEGARLMEHVFM